MSEKGAFDHSLQQRALWLSTISFTVCFAVWTIFAIIGIQIKQDLGLSDTEFGLLVGTPILTGSLIRLPLGIWSDQYGGRVVFTLTMLSAAVMTALLVFAYDYPTFLLAALGVVVVRGHPGSAWLVHLVGLVARTHLGRNGMQLAVDAMPLVVGVCLCIHFRRWNRLLVAMALAHRYLRVISERTAALRTRTVDQGPAAR